MDEQREVTEVVETEPCLCGSGLCPFCHGGGCNVCDDTGYCQVCSGSGEVYNGI